MVPVANGWIKMGTGPRPFYDGVGATHLPHLRDRVRGRPGAGHL